MIYYAGVAVLRCFAAKVLRFFGFSRRQLSSGVAYFHITPTDNPGILSVDGDERSPTKKPPIVFVHGLGVGLAPYLNIVRKLSQRSREVFVLELQEVTQSGVETVLPPS